MSRNRILAPVAFAATLAVAALTSSPRPAFAELPALSDGEAGSCGQGNKLECGSTTVYKCTRWKEQISFGTTGVSVTYVCEASVTQTSKSYRD